MIRNKLLFLFICGFSLMTALCTACGKNSPLDAELMPDMNIRSLSTVNYTQGTLSWELQADESSYYFDENISIAENIELRYYKDGSVSATVNSDQAIINTDSNDIDLIGDVNILSTSGNRLHTSKIKWNNREKYLDTDEPVVIIKKNGDIIKGTGLRADYDLEHYEIKRKIVAITRRIKDNTDTTEKK